MKPPIKSFSDLKRPGSGSNTYERPSPKVSRQQKAKVLSAAERAAFLAARPDLQRKD